MSAVAMSPVTLTHSDEDHAIGTRVRVMVNDSYLSNYTSGTMGATGTVVAHDSCENPRGLYVIFDGDAATDAVWVAYEEIAPVVGYVRLEGRGLTLPITTKELSDADLVAFVPELAELAKYLRIN